MTRFGYGDTWIIQLSGLAQTPGSVAWKQIDYKPVVVGTLSNAKTRYRTPQGPASAEWNRVGDDLGYTIEVPVGSTGTVTLESASVTLDGGRLAAGKDGVKSVEVSNGTTVINAGSGTYTFRAVLS